MPACFINVRTRLLQTVVLSRNLSAMNTKHFSSIIPSSYSMGSRHFSLKFPMEFTELPNAKSQVSEGNDEGSPKFQIN